MEQGTALEELITYIIKIANSCPQVYIIPKKITYFHCILTEITTP